MALPCKYFVASGFCKYGDNCRFDHPPRNTPSTSSSAAVVPRAAPEPALPSAGDLFAAHDDQDEEQRARPHPLSSWAGIFVPPDEALAAWEVAEEEQEAAEAEAEAAASNAFGGLTIIDDDEERFRKDSSEAAAQLAPASPAPPPPPPPPPPTSDGDGLCGQWAASGRCSRGDRCHLVHGDLCPTCGRNALHPLDESLRAAHAAECSALAARLAEVAASARVECAICLERVLSKEGRRPSDRRFGLLEGCAHAFCLPCIRSWRGQANTSVGAGGPAAAATETTRIDVATSLRTCPLCRTPAWFVTPSATWPATEEAKREIIEAYKTSLSRIECRWWDRGRGSCPFGTSCFYLHLDASGNEVARGAGLRFVGDREGAVKPISQGATLSDFLEFARVKGRRGGSGGR